MNNSKYLRIFSKFLCIATLFLIFAGGMVTSTGSGLAVPDWPLSYGTLFPPMIGGVFYEHGHRVIASFVGLCTLVLVIWLGISEKRQWVRYLGILALLAVVLQGILGGLTVLYFLPTPISVMHGVLAQTFFILTIVIAYSLSNERSRREINESDDKKPILKTAIALALFVYIQLIFGAIMRHTGAGLAIPDFPKMGGEWLPLFNTKMLAYINTMRFDLDLEPVSQTQVIFHFLHRLGAVIITLVVCLLNVLALKYKHAQSNIKSLVVFIDFLIVIQITLGITTVLTLKAPVITSLHVANGATILGISVVLILRLAPLKFKKFLQVITT